MRRLLGVLRSLSLPLLAIVGLALLGWCVVGWWMFHRALFLEEIAAVEALAEPYGVVEYRRQGETMPHEFDARKNQAREEVPWSVPFVGRLEQVEVTRRESDVPIEKPVRDRLLRLPGLRAYLDDETSYRGFFGEIGHAPEDLPFGRALPKPPPATLTIENLTEPFPESEALPEDEARALAQAIERGWNEETPDRPRLERVEWTVGIGNNGYEQKSWYIAVDDGPRRLEFGSVGVPRRLHEGISHLFLRTEEAVYAARSESAGWTFDMICDAELAESRRSDRRDGEGIQLQDSPWFASDPHEFPLFDVRLRPVDLLGPDGKHVERMERVDPVRLRLRTKPLPYPDFPDRTIRLDAIVRSDLNFAIERYEATDSESDYGAPVIRAGALRLTRSGGETVVTESLRTDWFIDPDSASEYRPSFVEEYVRERIVTEFNPDPSASLFDPATYERGLPEPIPLPLVRTYRVIAAAGAACLLLATCGWFFGVLSRRPLRESVETRPARKRFSPQFGLATLLALALLSISFAGWIKRHLDDAGDQTALLTQLSQENVSFRVERQAPGFPWLFFSTEALPLDAPLRRIEFQSLPSLAVQERALRLADVEYAVAASPEESASLFASSRSSFDDHLDALGGEVLDFQSLDWLDGAYDRTQESGVLLEGDARESVVVEALGAWKDAAAERPTTYLVREDVSAGSAVYERLTVRDGNRFRTCGLAGTAWIECRDDRYRRRFAMTGGEWRLALRRSLDIEGEVAAADARERAALEKRIALDLGVSEARRERTIEEARLPLAPHAVPPCVTEWQWMAPVNEALARLRPEDIVAAERVDDRRIRFELRYPGSTADDEQDPEQEPTIERPFVISWKIVARSDLEWSVERCDYVDEVIVQTKPVEVQVNPRAPVEHRYYRGRHRRELQSFHTLARRNGLVWFDGASFAFKESALGQVRKSIVGTAHYAVDLSPEFPGPVFDRATVDSPDPPLPERGSTLPWYLVTGTLACAGLVVLGAKRTLAPQHRGEKSAE